MSTAPSNVRLRKVVPSDIAIFYEQQSDPDAASMAAFPSRNHEAHVAHWAKILADDDVITRTILYGSAVAGNIVSWLQDGHRELGYWIGRSFWGRGIATAALRQFLEIIEERPLFAWVARHNTGSIRVLETSDFLFERHDGEYAVFKIR